MPRYCELCILPDTRPGVRLDDDGVCRGCRNAVKKKKIDWADRAAAFERLVARTKRRAKTYDCVIPVSGGKDSFWQVVTCLEHGLHPLCVTYVVPGRTALGLENLERLRALGVDHIDFALNPNVERAFIEKAFVTRGISGLVTHMAIYAMPVRLALTHDVPLVVYGENSAFEYGTEDDSLIGAVVDEPWLARFGVTEGTTALDWVDEDIPASALKSLIQPTDAELAERGVEVHFLGHYFAWDPLRSFRVAEAHGFRASDAPVVGHYTYVNIDDALLGIHQHTKWHKFGITRSWDTLSMEIRAGRLSRADAIAKLKAMGDETPHRTISEFCAYLGITEERYFEVVEQFRNPEIWSRVDGRWRIDGFLIPDFDWPER